jgi:hypothetical protein
MNKNTFQNIARLIGASLVLGSATEIFNLWVFSSHPYISPMDASFLEGILFFIIGALLFLGSGGINLWSQKAAVSAAATEAISGKETVGPSEIFRRDAWKPRGFIRLGLILMIAGIILLLIYFVSLYIAL